MSLMDVNPQELFQKHSVSDIEQVRFQIRSEIEKKKEELRVMVGERYRDLIDAADSISNMTVLSHGIISDVHKIASKSSISRASKIMPASKPCMTPVDSFAAQVKLLIDLNQQIWMCLDKRYILLATVLYQYAFYVKTNVDIEEPYSKLVAVQWKSMGHFQKTITAHCEKLLLELNPSATETCECFLSLALLENINTADLLDRYIGFRSRAVKNSFTGSEDSSFAKENVLNSYNILLSSISCIYKNFNEHNGLMWSHGASTFNTSVLKLMHVDETVLRNSKHLPDIVVNYKINAISLAPISLETISSTILSWLSNMKQEVQLGVESCLKFVLSLKLIQDMHNMAQVPGDISTAIKQLYLPNSLDIWKEMYQVHIIEKAKHLILMKWSQCFDSVHAEVLRAIKSCNSEKNKESELDLRWYTWKESNSDLEFHERKSSGPNSDPPSTTSGLLLKSHGYTPRVVSLCNSVQAKISVLNKDLRSVDQLNEEKVLTKYQTTCCEKSLARLVEFLLEQVNSESTSQSTCVLIARLSSCLTQFCPALRHTLDNSTDGTQGSGHSWSQATALIVSVNHKAWDRYIDLARAQYCLMFSSLDTAQMSLSYVLQSLAKWDTVALEEDSNIQVPTQPGLVLQESLLRFSSNLSRLSPSPYLREKLTHQVLDFVLAKFSPVAEDNTKLSSKELVQRMNVQSLFDVRYLANVLLTNQSKSPSKEKISETISRLEASIDMFDLELLRPSLHENIDKCVRKTQCLLGLAHAQGGHVTVSSSTGGQSSMSASPCVVPLSKNVPWFPLLVLSNTSAIQPLVSAAKKPPAAAANDPVTSLSASAKSTFFSVTEWFGST